MDYICPKGHHSTDPDYCSECGAKIEGAASALPTVDASAASAPATAPMAAPMAASAAPGQVCPDCGTPRSNSSATFCEVCRYNFATGTSYKVPTVASAPAAPAPPDPTTAVTSVVPPNAPAAPAPPDPVLPSAAPPAQTADAASATAPIGDALPLSAKWEAVVKVDPSLYTDPDPSVPCPVDEPERVFHLDFAENLIGRRSDRRDIHPEISLQDPGVSHRHAKLLRQPDDTLWLLDVGSTNGTLLNGSDVPEAVKTPLKDGDEITVGFWTRIAVRETRS
jgi:hypothetical protein